jgi:hypothetical protein
MTRNVFLLPKDGDISIVCSKYNLDVSVYPREYIDKREFNILLIEEEIYQLMVEIPACIM